MATKPSVDWLITQMKIIGGAEIYASQMVYELAKRGWDIRLITLVDDHTLSPRLQQQGVPVISLSAKSKTDTTAWMKLQQLWKKKKPQILHTHLFHAGILGRLVGRKMGIPIILCHQGGPELNRPFPRIVLDFVTSSLVDHYVVPCKAVERILHNRERIPPRKIDRIPNAIQPPPEGYLSQPFEDLQVNFAMPVKLITVGRLVVEKAQWVIVESVKILAMRNLNVSLSILGDGPLRGKLETQIKQSNLAAVVSLLGHQEHPFEWLSQSDLFVLTSLWESLSLALMEAMAIGLPVVATSTGGTPELITHLENGYLIPPNSPQTLADAIEYLIQNPEVARNIGKNARTHILDNYTIPRVADQLELYYWKLLESGAQP
ncbi:MAG: hypothetical protein DDG59_08305 [Anaerolineae bacterium]|jgi:glycosyltransferase involved in cell wall biosynthesis|nr:MAG: hypothetical protein DDG59_08305 [Anaerolineae bacterium]